MIVPVGRLDFLRPLLKSIPTGGALESLILSLDSSVDREEADQIVHCSDLQGPAITICSQQVVAASGASSTRNRGLEHADTEYCVFLDADDEIAPNAFEIVRSRIKELDRADAIYGNLANISSKGDWLSDDLVDRAPNCDDANALWIAFREGLSQLGAIYARTDYVRAIGGFNENLSSWTDRDFQYRLLLGGGRVCFVPDILMYWRHGHSGRLSSHAQTALDRHKRYIGDAWPRYLWDPVYISYRAPVIDLLYLRGFTCTLVTSSYRTILTPGMLSHFETNRCIADISPFSDTEKAAVFDLLFEGALVPSSC